MDKFEIFCKSVVEEVFQKNTIQRQMILKILHSKRLLSDHIDVLEIAYGDVQIKSVEPSTLFKFSQSLFLIAISAITRHLKSCWKYIIPALTFGYTSIYGVKLFHKLKHKLLLDRLQRLVQLLDHYELCIKRNLIFFNEINVTKSGTEYAVQVSSKIEREREVVYMESIKKISTVLYNLLTHMETKYNMPDKFETIYEGLEDLLNCDYFQNTFTKLTSRDAKAFYNIFAITQSQYLLRFGMTSAYYPITNLVLSDFKTISKNLRSEIQLHTNLLTRLTEIDQQIAKNKLSDRKTKSELSAAVGLSTETEITTLKNFSLVCSSKLMMLANECRHFDDEFQFSLESKTEYSKEFFLELYERMKMLETNFNLCRDEYQRFILTYNKYLNDTYKLEVGLCNGSEIVKATSSEARVTDVSKILSEQTPNLIEDDFFAVDMMNEINLIRKLSGDLSLDDELAATNNRLIKSKFKPVLTQLKEIIEPINEKMKIKEKQILASKGIIIDDNEHENSPKNVENDSSDTDSEDFEIQLAKKSKSYNKYNESREFLASKQINLLPNWIALGGASNNTVVNEDIIE